MQPDGTAVATVDPSMLTDGSWACPVTHVPGHQYLCYARNAQSGPLSELFKAWSERQGHNFLIFRTMFISHVACLWMGAGRRVAHVDAL